MWLPIYAVVVVLGSGVLAEGPLNLEAAQRQATVSNTTSGSMRAVDCADHLMAGSTTSGVYEIYPFTCTCGKPVLVWCDMETDGGGWTVLLNRQNQTQQLDFNRTWDDYKTGFGNPYSEYYLGNDLLHQMTHSRTYAIRLDVELVSGGIDFASYQNFKVNSEDNRYYSYLSGSNTGTSNLRNCLSYMNGRYFTTIDRDNDNYGGNCAAVKGGGWWYYNCRYSNPTSPYSNRFNMPCYGSTRPLKALQFKLRPSICESTFKTIHLNTMGCGCQDLVH